MLNAVLGSGVGMDMAGRLRDDGGFDSLGLNMGFGGEGGWWRMDSGNGECGWWLFGVGFDFTWVRECESLGFDGFSILL